MCSFVLVILLYTSFYDSCAGEPEVKIFVKKHSNGSIICPSDEIVSPKLNLGKTFKLHVYSNVIIQDGTFYEKFKIPGVIGCIDGTFVAMIRPKEHKERFYCCKGNHARNIQLILCTLSFLASGSYQKSIGKNVNTFLSQSATSRCISEVVEVLTHPSIVKKYIRFPQNANERQILKEKCFSTEAKTNYIKNFKNESNYYTSTEKLTLTELWTSLITCELYTCAKPIKCKKIRDQYVTQCNFNLDIRKPDLGYLMVNGELVPTALATEVDYFDNSGVYSYFDNEAITLTCHVNKSLSYAQVLLTNENENFSTKNEVHSTNAPAQMYAKMTANDNGSYVDCVLTNTKKSRKFISRIYFKIKNTKPALGFQVNGLILPSVKWPECNGRYCYKYEYYNGEKLDILSVKDGQIYGDMHCSTQPQPGHSTPKEFSSATKRQSSIRVSTVFEENKYNGSLFLHCFAKKINENYEENITLKEVYSGITLLLNPNTAAGRLIQGLSMANISVMVSSASLDTIYYNYDDKPLLLSCHSQAPSPRWDYIPAEVEKSSNVTANVSYAASMDELVRRGLFKLKDEQESSVITCISPNSTTKNNKTAKVIIKRHKKNKSALEVGDADLTSHSSDAGAAVVPEPRPYKLPDKKYLIIIACIAILVFVLVVTCFIMILSKRKPQKPNDPTDIHYENLPEHKKGVMPVPPQWNEAQYAAPTDSIANSDYAQPYIPRSVEEMYSQPTPKDQRGYEDPAYASVGEINAMYSEAVPKSKRIGQGVQVLPTTGNLVYAKLKTIPKKMKDEHRNPELKRESPYASVTFSESPYAEASQRESPYASVTPSESAYAEPECTKEYGNVFEGDRYVNANTSVDYAEPAYCDFNSYKPKK